MADERAGDDSGWKRNVGDSTGWVTVTKKTVCHYLNAGRTGWTLPNKALQYPGNSNCRRDRFMAAS